MKPTAQHVGTIGIPRGCPSGTMSEPGAAFVPSSRWRNACDRMQHPEAKRLPAEAHQGLTVTQRRVELGLCSDRLAQSGPLTPLQVDLDVNDRTAASSFTTYAVHSANTTWRQAEEVNERRPLRLPSRVPRFRGVRGPFRGTCRGSIPPSPAHFVRRRLPLDDRRGTHRERQSGHGGLEDALLAREGHAAALEVEAREQHAPLDSSVDLAQPNKKGEGARSDAPVGGVAETADGRRCTAYPGSDRRCKFLWVVSVVGPHLPRAARRRLILPRPGRSPDASQ